MIVDLPLPLNKANARHHWRTTLKAKKDYWHLCSMLLSLGRLPQPPKMPPLKSVITCHVVVGNVMDLDNLIARLKWGVDWLVANDYLRGDSPEYLEWGAMPTQEARRGVPYRAIFTLEPAAEEAKR